MSGSRLAGVIVIFVLVTAAWGLLSGAMYSRTTRSEKALTPRVEGLWGGPHAQIAPIVTASPVANGVPGNATPLVLDSSTIDVDIEADFRRKGLLWYRTYEVEFDGAYAVTVPTGSTQRLAATLRFPAQQATYDAFRFTVGGRAAEAIAESPEGVTVGFDAAPGSSVPIEVHYRSRGLNAWKYAFGTTTTQVNDCTVTVHTNFERVDFPDSTLAPSEKTSTPEGWDLKWEFQSLVSALGIAVEMPERLDPGPWATRVSAYAPIGLFFFLAVLVIVAALNGHSFHAMHYAFTCAAWFSFHLLLAYLVDHIDVHAAFAISAGTSVALVVTYLARAVGLRFTLSVVAPSQLVFLVLFSYSFFFPGYTGLSVTIGAILTLAILMHLTAKVDWDQNFGPEQPTPSPPDPSLPTRLKESRERDLSQHPMPTDKDNAGPF